MNILGPTRFHRLNEAGGLVYLFAGFFLMLCLISFHPQDPSWNLVSGAKHAQNLTGLAGSYIADLCFQLLGLSAFSLPVLLWLLAWKWIRSSPIQAAGVKVFGAVVFFLSISTALSIRPIIRPWNGAFSAGGVIGILIADSLLATLNVIGTVLFTSICLILSLYLISRFSMATIAHWLAGPLRFLGRIYERWEKWREQRIAVARERAEQRTELRAQQKAEKQAAKAAAAAAAAQSGATPPLSEPQAASEIPVVDRFDSQASSAALVEEPPVEHEIPIHELEYQPLPSSSSRPPWEEPAPQPAPEPVSLRKPKRIAPELVEHPAYRLPSTELLNEVPARNPFDSGPRARNTSNEIPVIPNRMKSTETT